MRVKKCPTKIVVVDLEDTSLDDESVDSGLPSADCAAPADIKKYEQGEDEDMPVLYPEVVVKEEPTEETVVADVPPFQPPLSNKDRLRLKRRHDVQMEETELLKCIAHGFPGRQLRDRRKIIESIKSEAVQPAAKRQRKEGVKPHKPTAPLNLAKKPGRTTKLLRKEEDEKLQQSVMNILKEARLKMKNEVAAGILKQRMEFQELWKSRLRNAPAVESAAEAKQSLSPIKPSTVKSKSFSEKSKVSEEKNNHLKKRGRPRKNPVETPVVTRAATEVALLLTRARSDRTVKPVDGVAIEQLQLRKRKKGAPVQTVREKKKRRPRKCGNARGSAKFVSPKNKKVAANDKFLSNGMIRLPRQCRRNCVAYEVTAVDERVVSDKAATMDKPPLEGGAGDMLSIGNSGEDPKVETGATVTTVRKKESPRKQTPTIKVRAEKADGRIANSVILRQRKVVLGRKQKAASMQREKVELTKEQEREAKRAAREAKRQMKLEEQRKKREARRLKKEMKEKLLKEKRERREAERKKLEEERMARKKKRKGTVATLKIAEEAKKVYVPSPCDGAVPIADLSFCYRIFVSGKVFLNRWLVLDEITSHRYGVAAYMVVENTEDKTQMSFYIEIC